MQETVSGMTGWHGTGENLCVLSPFCVTDGVMMPYDVQETCRNKLRAAYICGVQENQALLLR